MLSLDAVFKYREATVARLVELVSRCRRPAATRLALLQWQQLFNLLVGNGDAHLKNLSFLPKSDSGGMELAPHYDLLSTAVYRAPDWGGAELVIPMGSARTIDDVGRDDVVAFASALGVPERTTMRQLERVATVMRAHARQLVDAYQAGEHGRPWAGEARLLRQITYGVTEQALRQLGF